jgi:hypothetical protein
MKVVRWQFEYPDRLSTHSYASLHHCTTAPLHWLYNDISRAGVSAVFGYHTTTVVVLASETARPFGVIQQFRQLWDICHTRKRVLGALSLFPVSLPAETQRVL